MAQGSLHPLGQPLDAKPPRYDRSGHALEALLAGDHGQCMLLQYFPDLLTREESDALVDRIGVAFEQHGFGLWAVEFVATSEFLGFTGLAVPG